MTDVRDGTGKVGIGDVGVLVERSDDMLAEAWIAYDGRGRTVAMGALGMGRIRHGNGPATRITVGRVTWHELMAATSGAPDRCRSPRLC